MTLGTAEGGWDRQRVEAELRHVLADVERGIWQPASLAPSPLPPRQEPTFHEFASEWFADNKHGWAERTIADYKWALSDHLLPHFANHRFPEITVSLRSRSRRSITTEQRSSKRAGLHQPR
jgi:Phage integrase, N-terminal SAM-like domain